MKIAFSNIAWEHNYDLDKPSLSNGGQILVSHNLIFFAMPNGRIGAIDNIVGDQVDYSFLEKIEQKNIIPASHCNK